MAMPLLCLLVAAVLLGGRYGRAKYGYAGWAPAALILALLVTVGALGGLRL